jgi:hypothetical protein
MDLQLVGTRRIAIGLPVPPNHRRSVRPIATRHRRTQPREPCSANAGLEFLSGWRRGLQITSEDGSTIHLSAAALGFLAGYNTDFLFSAVERLVAALFPKVTPETMRTERGGATIVEGISLKDLLARLSAANTEAERKFYEGLINAVKKRI